MVITAIIGVVASVTVAIGTMAAGLRCTVRWIYNRGRQAEREDADKNKMKQDLENLKKRAPKN